MGATYTTRVAEFDRLKSQIAYMEPEEKEKWATTTEMMDTETSPELRRRSVECLGNDHGPNCR